MIWTLHPWEVTLPDWRTALHFSLSELNISVQLAIVYHRLVQNNIVHHAHSTGGVWAAARSRQAHTWSVSARLEEGVSVHTPSKSKENSPDTLRCLGRILIQLAVMLAQATQPSTEICTNSLCHMPLRQMQMSVVLSLHCMTQRCSSCPRGLEQSQVQRSPRNMSVATWQQDELAGSTVFLWDKHNKALRHS